MKMYLYVLSLTLVMGSVLSALFNALKPMTDANRENAKKASILSCVQPNSQNPAADFDTRITVKLYYAKDNQVIEDVAKVNEMRKAIPGYKAYKNIMEVDLANEDKIPVEERVYPFYEYKNDQGQIFKILSIRGKGLWDKIWGYVAVDNQGVIQGVYFDHKGETPGLGAEIKESEKFKSQFKGKKIFALGGAKLENLKVQKRSIKRPDHEVMGISGATITCEGLTEMLQRGIAIYEKQLLAAK